MAGSQDSGAAGAIKESDKAVETLSQFVARVLNQLSLSAWLPSAALVLLLTFIAQLGAALAARPTPRGPFDAMGRALTAIGHTSIGGALLLLAAVVVLTMVTQAFSFEAIRLLEGYWGTNRIIEWYAGCRCRHYRNVRVHLDEHLRRLTEDAWAGAARRIEDDQRRADPGGPVWTPDMIHVLGARVLGNTPLTRLSPEDMRRVRKLDWRTKAPPDLIRRRVNVQKRIRDYPQPERVLPTRLGNILRRHEDQTEQPNVETFIQRVFDSLPLSLRIEHDEQRTRLDLYCSMVFVIGTVILVAIARFAAENWGYAVGSAAAGLLGMWLMYRAALATARAYGGLLLVISDHVRQTTSRAASGGT